jgi:hypothetical protein
MRKELLIAMAALAVGVACGGAGSSDGATEGSTTHASAASGDTVSDPDSVDEEGTSDADDSSPRVDAHPGSSGSTGEDCDAASEGQLTSIWIANSPEGTVSKIDTATGVEVARYYTGPTNGLDDPSHTAVNLIGDVAVANHAGGMAKFVGRKERCVDHNGDGMITTSDGPEMVLPFGHDECLSWYVALPWPERDNLQGPRPAAWDAGHGECLGDDARVWTGWWVSEENTAYFRRLDGSTGATSDEVVVPNYSPGNDWGYGPYSSAVDAEGNFWVSGLLGPLVRIDGVSLDYAVWPVPSGAGPFGMSLDANGHPWMVGEAGAIVHFDPETETYEVYSTPNGLLRGMMIDRSGHLWAAGNEPCALVQFDTGSRTVINGAVALPGCIMPIGIAIDIDGFVWAPDQGVNVAYKVDPITYASTSTTGLIQPYTYSDMIGTALRLVVDPP